MKKAVLLAKGPSLTEFVSAGLHTKAHDAGWHFISVNEALAAVPGVPFEYVCCADYECVVKAQPHFDRVHGLVLPEILHVDRRPGIATQTIRTLGHSKVQIVPYESPPPVHVEIERRARDTNEIVGGYTSMIALSFARIRRDYRKWWLVGFDGGPGYAEGVHPSAEIEGRRIRDSNDIKREKTIYLGSMYAQHRKSRQHVWPDTPL